MLKIPSSSSLAVSLINYCTEALLYVCVCNDQEHLCFVLVQSSWRAGSAMWRCCSGATTWPWLEAGKNPSILQTKVRLQLFWCSSSETKLVVKRSVDLSLFPTSVHRRAFVAHGLVLNSLPQYLSLSQCSCFFTFPHHVEIVNI